MRKNVENLRLKWFADSKFDGNGKPEALGSTVIFALEKWRGLDNLDPKHLKLVDWNEAGTIKVRIKDEIKDLTQLITISSDLDLFVSVRAANINLMELSFSTGADESLDDHIRQIRAAAGFSGKAAGTGTGRKQDMTLQMAADHLNSFGYKPKDHVLADGELHWQISKNGDHLFALSKDPDRVFRLDKTPAIHRSRQLLRRAANKAAAAGIKPEDQTKKAAKKGAKDE